MKDFDLLAAMPRRRERAIALRFLLPISLSIVAFAAAVIYPYYRINLLERQLALEQKQVNKTSSINASEAALFERLKQQIGIVDSIVKGRINYSDAMDKLQRLKPSRITIYETRYSGSSIEIDGLASSIADVTEFLVALNDSGYYKDAIFNSINASPEPAGYIFKISARVVPTAEGR